MTALRKVKRERPEIQSPLQAGNEKNCDRGITQMNR